MIAPLTNQALGVLFYDTFAGADGTLLTAHTPDIDVVGGGWAVGSTTGAPSILTNRAISTAGDRIAVANVGQANYSIQVTYTRLAATTNALYIPIRWGTTTSFYYVRVQDNGANLSVVLLNPGITVLANVATTLSVGPTYTVNVTVSGSTVTASMVDDTAATKTVTYASLSVNAASTRCGIGVQQALAALSSTADNFEVAP